MAKMVKKSVAPFYLVAALWLGWALLLPLYRPLHYVLAGVASAIVFVLGKAIWPNKAYQTPDPEPGAPRPEAQAGEEDHRRQRAGQTGGAEGPGPLRDAPPERGH